MDWLNTLRMVSRDMYVHPTPTYTENDYPDLTGKVYLVTGASSGIGFEAARLLVEKGAFVWLTGKTKERMDRSVAKLKAQYPNGKFDYFLIDYNDLSTIKPSMEAFLKKLDRLDGVIHNAGLNYVSGKTTAQGYELRLGVNAVAPHLVQKFLDPILIKTAETAPANSVRLVWVASTSSYMSPSNGGINWDDLNHPQDGLLHYGIYGQSKAMNIYQGILWPKKVGSKSNVVSVSVHPGIVQSDIRRNATGSRRSFMQGIGAPTVEGAYAELYPLLSPSVTQADNGTFFVPHGQKASPRSDIVQGANGPNGEKLWTWLEDQVAKFL
jgi:protochlorophyllide reductase